jgi:hypothetical protein
MASVGKYNMHVKSCDEKYKTRKEERKGNTMLR